MFYPGGVFAVNAYYVSVHCNDPILDFRFFDRIPKNRKLYIFWLKNALNYHSTIVSSINDVMQGGLFLNPPPFHPLSHS